MSDVNSKGTNEPGRSRPSRRDVIRQASLGLTAFGLGMVPGPMQPAAAAAVHGAIAQQTGGYTPQLFKPHEWLLLRALAERILPADERSGSALDAGAPEFIDLLCSVNPKLERIFVAGMLWLDHEMNGRFGVSFANATVDQQEQMLDLLADATEVAERGSDAFNYQSYDETVEYQGYHEYRTRKSPELLPGVQFFGWARRMVVDAFYTSEIGRRDVDYRGNQYTETFEVPEQAIRYVIERSPFGKA